MPRCGLGFCLAGGGLAVQHEAVRGVDGGGEGGAGAPAAAPRLGGAPMAVVVVALLPAPPRLGEFRMQEVVAVAPNRYYFVFSVIRCSNDACAVLGGFASTAVV